MTNKFAVSSAIESIMVASKERCVTKDELCNPNNMNTVVIMARAAFYRFCREFKIMYDLDIAELFNIDVSMLKLLYGYPLGTTEFIWYNSAMIHYDKLTKK